MLFSAKGSLATQEAPKEQRRSADPVAGGRSRFAPNLQGWATGRPRHKHCCCSSATARLLAKAAPVSRCRAFCGADAPFEHGPAPLLGDADRG